jgi:hypothetical protein
MGNSLGVCACVRTVLVLSGIELRVRYFQKSKLLYGFADDSVKQPAGMHWNLIKGLTIFDFGVDWAQKIPGAFSAFQCLLTGIPFYVSNP